LARIAKMAGGLFTFQYDNRARVTGLIDENNNSAQGVLFSEGVVGWGKAFYQAVVAQGHEGVMAKHWAAPYRPGRRSPTWRKIKPERNTTRRGPMIPRLGQIYKEAATVQVRWLYMFS
jgi:hypothetical protein